MSNNIKLANRVTDPREVLDTTDIMLISNTSGVELTIDNVSEVYKTATTNAAKLTKGTDGIFHYDSFSTGLAFFNQVIFVKNEVVLGFCNLPERKVSDTYDIEILSSGTPSTEPDKPNDSIQVNSEKSVDYFGGNPWNYVTDLEIKVTKVGNKFTSSAIEASKSGKAITLGGSFLEGENLIRLNLKSNLRINQLEKEISNFWFTYYMGTPVLVIKFDDDNRALMYTLTQTNLFGDPILINKASTECVSGVDIIDFSGSMYTYRSDGKVLINNLMKFEQRPLPEDIAFLNSWDITNKLYLSKQDLYSIKDINSLTRLVGSWKVYSDGDNLVWSGEYGNLTVKKDERVIAINDNALMILDKDYHTLYTFSGKSFISEQSRGGVNTALSLPNGNTIKFSSRNKDLADQYKGYYEEGIIEVISLEDPLWKSPLMRYRKNAYPINIKSLREINIVGSLSGVIFYTTNNNTILNYF